MKKKKKNPLTLLEVTIAISITGFLLSALWGMYKNWYASYDKSMKMQAGLHRTIFFKQRLEHLFSSVANPFETNYIFTPKNQNSICFSYIGSPDPDPVFNKTVRSLLYIDVSKVLCLTTWSRDLQSRTEVLIDGVSELAISFFDRETGVWQPVWPEETDHLPLWVKLKVKTEKEEEDFVFKASHPKEPILFLERFEGGRS